jgi:ATP-dependent helicase Lhr and Lhr-like helicase
VVLAATDPANPYGATLRWPVAEAASSEAADADGQPRSLTRSVGASVILRNGEMVAFLRRGNPNLQVFLPPEEPERSQAGRDLSQFLVQMTQEELRQREGDRGAGLLIAQINSQPAGAHFLARFLQDAGFHVAPNGFNVRRVLPPALGHEGSEPSAPIEIQ